MKEKKSIVFGIDGQIIVQSSQVQRYLDQSIVGESELQGGVKFLMSSVVKENGIRSITILESSKKGQFDKVFTIQNLNEKLP